MKGDEKLRRDTDFTRNLIQDGPELTDAAGRRDYWIKRLGEKAPVSRGIKGLIRDLGGIRDVEGKLKDALGDTMAGSDIAVTLKGAARTKRGLEAAAMLKELEKEGFKFGHEEELYSTLKGELDTGTTAKPEGFDAIEKAFSERSAYNKEMAEAAGSFTKGQA